MFISCQLVVILVTSVLQMVFGLQYITIGDNFLRTIDQMCASFQRIKLFTKSSQKSLIKEYIREIHSKNCFVEYHDLQRINDSIGVKNYNLLLEMTDRNDMDLIPKNVFDEVFSMSNNVLVIMNWNSLEDMSREYFRRFSGFRCYLISHENDLKSVKVSLIRPVINGCHLIEGVLSSADNRFKDVVKSKSCNLNGSRLTVSVNRDLPFCDLDYRDGKYVMKASVEFEMLTILSKKFNFVYDIIYANQSWGTIENGLWVGSVGHLINKVSDN